MKTLKNGSVDPQVKLDENGKQGSTFDARGSGRQCVPQQVCRACRVEQADDFIEPHAVTDKVKDLAMAGLKKAGLKVVGSIKAEVIDKTDLFDQHYYAIASQATILKPEQLNVPEDSFRRSLACPGKMLWPKRSPMPWIGAPSLAQHWHRG